MDGFGRRVRLGRGGCGGECNKVEVKLTLDFDAQVCLEFQALVLTFLAEGLTPRILVIPNITCIDIEYKWYR